MNGPGMLVLRVRVAWWFHWYAQGVILVARLTGLRPDREKVMAKAAAAVSIQVHKPCERCRKAREALKRLLPGRRKGG